jgi:hypothetical protein
MVAADPTELCFYVGATWRNNSLSHSFQSDVFFKATVFKATVFQSDVFSKRRFFQSDGFSKAMVSKRRFFQSDGFIKKGLINAVIFKTDKERIIQII